MKRMNVKLFTLFAAALVFYGCEKEDDLLESASTANQVMEGNCDVIDFEGYSGYVSEVNSAGGFGPVSVYGLAITPGNEEDESGNRAMIFNSEAPTGDDDDLETTDWGNVLIVQQLGYEADPNDNWSGGELTLTFPQPVTLESMNVIDIDNGSKRDGGESNHPLENESFAYLYVEGSATPVVVQLVPHGDNVGFTVDLLGTENVVKMVVDFDGPGAVGSGAIDDIRFCVPEEEEHGCTYTQGYWKNHATGKKADPAWNGLYDDAFYNSGQTYLQVLNTAPKQGNAYYILAHQFIAAKLNMINASSTDEVDEAFAAAEDYFKTNTPGDPYKFVSKQTLVDWAETLAKYNEGEIGPGHCDE